MQFGHFLSVKQTFSLAIPLLCGVRRLCRNVPRGHGNGLFPVPSGRPQASPALLVAPLFFPLPFSIWIILLFGRFFGWLNRALICKQGSRHRVSVVLKSLTHRVSCSRA